ncbi:hypothetical protein [Fibrella aquatica]|uniref:hypothetical protein n=1 Tax=Fibrella aquatica TaxID=3242487 RepID=UPI0035221146
MKIRTTSLALFTGVVLLFSCKKSSDTVSPDGCQLAETRAQALQQAAVNLTTSSTPANCQAYKTAANAYIDAAARCTTIPKADLDAARKSLADMTC